MKYRIRMSLIGICMIAVGATSNMAWNWQRDTMIKAARWDEQLQQTVDMVASLPVKGKKQ